jgi:urease accessory protein UreE
VSGLGAGGWGLGAGGWGLEKEREGFSRATVIVVEHVFRDGALPSGADDFARDTVTLGWEDRTHVHGRRRSDGGVEFGTALPRGTVLRSGDCFVLEAARLIVAVVERLEPVFVVTPRSEDEWALFAYHIGNRHQPMMVAHGALVCPDAPGVDQLLQQHHMPYVRTAMAFTPVAATAGHRHA